MNSRKMLSIQATPDTSSIRTAELMDVEHTVIPVIALVEGVLWPANAPSPELALAEEFGRFPDGWNGRPVMLDHPKIDGFAVSASSPDVLGDSAVGQMFNTVLTDDNKLKSEIWINSERMEALSEDDRASVQRLIDGDTTVEVSTGLFMMLEEHKGMHDEKEFEGIWRNIVPDHLAILPEGITGACSVADGCGAPRSNATAFDTSGTSGTGDYGAYSYTSNEFATFDKPVMRAAEMKTSNDTPECKCQEPDPTTNQGIFERLLETLGGTLSFLSNDSRRDAALADVNVRDALHSALSKSETDWFYILAVFEEGNGSGNSGTVVYELGGETVQQSYSISSESGVILLSNDKVAVRPVTQFVPVDIVANSGDVEAGGSLEENAMNKAELVASLVSNEATHFTAEDQPWLESLEEAHLAKLMPVENAAAPTPEATVTTEVTPTDDTAGDAETPVTMAAYIEDAPAEIAEVLKEGVRLQSARKNALITGLVANERCKFTKDALEAKPLEELENLATLSADVTFEVANTSTEGDLRDNATEEANFTPAPSMFSTSDAA